jgi:hypothetical protein
MFMNDSNNGYRPQGGQTWNQLLYYQGGNQAIVHMRDPSYLTITCTIY